MGIEFQNLARREYIIINRVLSHDNAAILVRILLSSAALEIYGVFALHKWIFLGEKCKKA